MPTERAKTRGASGTRSTAVAAVEMRESHRNADVAGIGLLALALIVLAALAMPETGVVGSTLGNAFTNLLGKAAWIVPVLFGGLGWAYLAGKGKIELSRLTFGLSMVALAIIGMMARTVRADYFDPEAIRTSGGYLGALMGWAMTSALGQAALVGHIAILLVGLVLCANSPLRTWLKPVTASKKPIKAMPKVQEEPEISREARRSALRDALVRIGDGLSQPTQAAPVADEAQTVMPTPKTKAKPVIRETQIAPSLFSEQAPAPAKEGYTLPPGTLLNAPVEKPRRTASEMQRNIEILEGTLEQFGIDANVVEVATGPTITRYEIQLGPGIRVGRITALGDNIAMNLAASHVRVEAPIPGKAAVGVEVPNATPSMVTLREVCETKEFQEHPSRLIVALGQDVSGNNRYADLTKMPHLLIGGATNSGKSIGLAAIIMSLLMRNTPKDVRMVMIDPKRVELSLFEGVPHLMCPVVKDVKEAPGVLRAVWREMDVRYDRFSEAGVRNIDGWNAKASFQDKLPYIVVIVDELADLMIQAAAEVETSIVRLAQLARAVGIHLVIATQRPSVDVITGTIKANIPSRMAFSVSSQVDSRTILDQSGAERLVGKGDMLFMPIDANKPTRIQGCYVSEKEIELVCKHWRDQEAPHYVLNPIAVAIADREREMSEQEDDPLWEDGVRFVVERGQASTSMLQRRFSIGFQRASRLLDLMEERGIVGPRDGPRPREVLVDPMEVEQMFGRGYNDNVDLKIDLDDE